MLRVGVNKALDWLQLLSMNRHHQDLEFLIFNGVWRADIYSYAEGFWTHIRGCGPAYGVATVKRNKRHRHGSQRARRGEATTRDLSHDVI